MLTAGEKKRPPKNAKKKIVILADPRADEPGERRRAERQRLPGLWWSWTRSLKEWASSGELGS